MEQKWNYNIKYTTLGDTTHMAGGTFSPPYKADAMFQFVTDYAKNGSWADKKEDYSPVIIKTPVRDIDALTQAKWFFHEYAVRAVVWDIAKRCAASESFESQVLQHCKNQKKELSEKEKKNFENALRTIKDKKNGKKSVSWIDYCYFPFTFPLYKITDFSAELLDEILTD